MPLCNISTARKYLNTVKINCGIDYKFMAAFKNVLQSKSESQRHGVLIFDEVQVRKSTRVNCNTMKIDGIVDFSVIG